MKAYHRQHANSKSAVLPDTTIYKKAPQPSYEGKASRLWAVVGHPDKLIIERKNDVTKLDGEVRSSIEDKGTYTNRISNALFCELEQSGINTHYLEELNDHETLIRKTDPFDLEVIVRNFATGSLCKRLPFEEGVEFGDNPLVEFDYKNDEFHDPLINWQHAVLLGIATCDELEKIETIALDVNDVLKDFFQEIGIILVDFKLEFGRTSDGTIIVIDEISPDTCRLWDAETKRSLDKDVFRKGMGEDATAVAYKEAFDRITASIFSE